MVHFEHLNYKWEKHGLDERFIKYYNRLVNSKKSSSCIEKAQHKGLSVFIVAISIFLLNHFNIPLLKMPDQPFREMNPTKNVCHKNKSLKKPLAYVLANGFPVSQYNTTETN